MTIHSQEKESGTGYGWESGKLPSGDCTVRDGRGWGMCGTSGRAEPKGFPPALTSALRFAPMPRTVRQCIVEALENLGKSQLRRFKEDLSEVQYRPGFSAIPRGRLEDADALDLGRLLISSFRDDYAAELTLQVLEALPEREVADSLRRSLPSPAERQSTGTGPYGSTAHPVDLHHHEIVQRFHSADSVLDRLLSRGTITAEQYDLARAQATRTEKNRALLRIVGDKGKEAKEQLWRDMESEDAMFTQNLAGQ